jgi:hypothetical protein
MRKVIDLQLEFWKKDISQIRFDLKSRDEIPKVLMGLQHIYTTREIRDEVFNILSQIVPKKSCETGRPGMDLWKILVLGTLRANCNCDYDKLHELANNHRTVRLMLGHGGTQDESLYALQTIRDNVSLLTPEMLEEINQIVVRAGHGIVGEKEDDDLRASCDSFVVETDVHYPTDTNLLFDAMRKMIKIIAVICSEFGMTEWRQSHHNILKIKRMLRGLEKLKRSRSKDERKIAEREELIVNEYQKYIDTCQGFIVRIQETMQTLRRMRVLSVAQDLALSEVENYIVHADRQIDQIYRRVILEEKIPHEEKVFSIFEPHTEWITKGKAGVPQELGLNVCVVKDQYGFILYHEVLERQTDEKVAIPIIQETKDRFPNVARCTFDKGFYSPENKRQLANMLDCVILPKKGRLSNSDKEVEYSEEFVQARRKHSAVESAINALENHGLDRCLDHGLQGFKRYVALSVLGRNLQILGHILQQKELMRQKRRKAA